MRVVAVLTALLLLLVPLAAAQDDSDSSSSSSSTTSSSTSGSEGPQPDDDGAGNETDHGSGDDPDEVACPLPDRRPVNDAEKAACYCQQNPDADPCDRHGPSEVEDREAGEWRAWCRDEAGSDAQRERCRRALDDFGSEDGDNRRISFDVDAANRTLLNYSIDGRLTLAAIALDTGSGNLTVQRLGSALRMGDADTELVLHDDPTGLVRFKGDDGSVTVRFADGSAAAIAEDGDVARITFADGRIGHVRSGNATWLDGQTVLVAGFFAFLLPPADEHRQDGDSDDGDEAEVEREVHRAITQRKVGAEISVSAPAAPASLASGEAGNGTVHVLAYDDVEVEVNVPSEIATPEAPIRVRVSAELDEGRTIVLNLNRSVLEAVDSEALVLRYFDLYVQPDGSEVETEVLFAAADGGLQDILDPTDDRGQPEYWVVEDANGLQVLVSVPHWSAHAITVGSVARALSEPSVLVGIGVGLVGSAVAAVAMLWPRRPDEE